MTIRNRVKYRRRAPKQKPIEIKEVDGHQLTPKLYGRYKQALVLGTSSTAAHALDHVISPYRPSMRAKSILNDAFRDVSDAGLALGHMADYLFCSTGGGVRLAGCGLLEKLEYEIFRASVKVMRLRRFIEAEAATKVQDWLDLDRALDPTGILRPEQMQS